MKQRPFSEVDVRKYAHYLWWRFGDGSFDIPERNREYFMGWAATALPYDKHFEDHMYEEGAVAA